MRLYDHVSRTEGIGFSMTPDGVEVSLLSTMGTLSPCYACFIAFSYRRKAILFELAEVEIDTILQVVPNWSLREERGHSRHFFVVKKKTKVSLYLFADILL